MSTTAPDRNEDDAPGPAAKRRGPQTPRRRRRLRRLLYTLVVGVLLYTLFGFFGVPLLIRHVGIPQLNDRINGTVSLARASFNPYALRLTLEGFELLDAMQQRVAAFARFEGNVQLVATLFRPGYHFRTGRLEEPFLFAEVPAEGPFNLAALAKPAAEAGAAEPGKPLERIPRVVVQDLGIGGAHFRFRDASLPEPFEAEVRELTFDLNDFDTRPDKDNVHSLTARSTAGGQLSWEGGVYVDPLSSRGRIHLSQIDLARFMPYALRHTTGRLVQGKLACTLAYDFAPLRRPRQASVGVEAITLSDVRIEQDGEPVLELPELAVSAARVDADARTLHIGGVAVTGAAITVRREASGELTATRLAPAAPGAAPAESSAAEAPAPQAPRVDPDAIPYPLERLRAAIDNLVADVRGAWTVEVDDITWRDGSLRFVDEAAPGPVDVALSAIQLQAGPIRSAEAYRVPLTLTLSVDQTGGIDLAGSLEPGDGRLKLDKLNVQDLDLTAIAPYLPRELPEPLPPIALGSARLFLDGALSAARAADADIDVAWSGEVRLESLRVDHAETGAAALQFERLRIAGDTAARQQASGPPAVTWKGDTELSGLDLDLPLAGPVEVALGRLGVGGELEVAAAAGGGAAVSFKGDVEIAKGSARTPDAQDGTYALEHAVLRGLDLHPTEGRIAVEDVDIEGPHISIAVALLPAGEAAGEGGEAEAAGAEAKASGDAAPTAAGAAAPASGAPLDLRIGHARVQHGVITLRDEHAEPPVVLSTDELSIELSNFAIDGKTVAEIDVQSRLHETGRIGFKGRIDPFRARPYADVELAVAGLPLKPFDPFAGRYVGYLIDRGRLTVKLPLTVEEGVVKGTLDFNFDAFYLADRVDSPDAPDVPVKLGLDLLRDMKEQITAKVPVSGNMDDPSFSFGGLIWQAFFNLLFKATTAPFQVVGALFGGAADQDLSQVAFEPGSDRIGVAAQSSLDVLARALRERPALSLQAEGHYRRDVDMAALRAAVLREQMLARVRAGQPAVQVLDDAAYRAAIEAAYREQVDAAARPADGAAPSHEAMAAAVAEAIAVPDERLADLARRRAEAVVAVFVQDNGIAAERLAASVPEDADGPEPVVTFELK